MDREPGGGRWGRWLGKWVTSSYVEEVNGLSEQRSPEEAPLPHPGRAPWRTWGSGHFLETPTLRRGEGGAQTPGAPARPGPGPAPVNSCPSPVSRDGSGPLLDSGPISQRVALTPWFPRTVWGERRQMK